MSLQFVDELDKPPDDAAALLRRLLPPFYWEFDAATGGTLRALVDAIAAQYASLHGQVETLYEDVFLETCAERLVPYFADELGMTGLAAVDAPGLSLRAWVGQLLGFRRRKGTLATLARGCAAASGWAVYAQPGRAAVARTQTLLHPEPSAGRFVDVRDPDARALLGRPWSTTARTVSIAGTSVGAGRFLPGAPDGPRDFGSGPAPLQVELSVWRLQSFPVTSRTPWPVSAPGTAEGTAFTFRPFGVDTQLFRLPETAGDPLEPPAPQELPTPVSRRELAAALAGGDAGPPLPFTISVPMPMIDDPAALSRTGIGVADLSDWAAPLGAGVTVFVDPELGRMLWTKPAPPGVVVDYAYGFSGELGGGPYAVESQWRDPDPATTLLRVSRRYADAYPFYGSLEAAIAEVAAHAGEARSWRIVIEDSGTYTAPSGAWTIALGPDAAVHLTTLPGASPVLVGDLSVELAEASSLWLVGLLVAGRLDLRGTGTVTVGHCTLDPSRCPSIDARAAETPLALTVANAILGAISTGPSVHVTVHDSIVDGEGGAAIGSPVAPVSTADLACVTVLGDVYAGTLVGEQSLFAGRVHVDSPTDGILRDSYFGPGSVPPDIVIGGRRPARDPFQSTPPGPLFTSTRYGAAGYCQLSLDADPTLRAGGDEGVELGAFSKLQQPARAARLERVAAEFLPAGLTAAVTYRT